MGSCAFLMPVAGWRFVVDYRAGASGRIGTEIAARAAPDGYNLLMGSFSRSDKAGIAASLEMVLGRFPRLKERYSQAAGTMSGGEQQMLAIARALMSAPRLLLLDEPSLGLAPLIVDQVFELIDGLRHKGLTVLLVEQNAERALEIADQGYVLQSGQVVLQGTGRELAQSDLVRSAYLSE